MSFESPSDETDQASQTDHEPMAEADIPAELAANWRYVVGAGAVIAVLGVLAIFTPFVTSIGLSILLGVLLLVGAVTHAVQAFYAGGWTKSIWQVVLAIVYGVSGVALVANPALGLVTLTVLLIVYFLIEGVVEIVLGINMRSQPQWGWFVLSGMVSLLLAGLLFAGFPSTALWAVGLLFGVNLLSTGVSMLFVGNVGRKAARGAVETTLGDEQTV